MRRATAGAARMRACSDAMPSRPRRALQRRALWPSRCARRGPCNVAMAFRVAGNVHTCSTGKVIAVSTFHDSEFPRRKKKKKSTCSVRKHRGSRTHCTGKLKGRGPPGFWEFYFNSFQEPARAIQIPDYAPRRGFWNLDRFQDPDIAMQNPTYAPRPAIWKLKDIKIQIPNSETAVSVYAPALSLHLCRSVEFRFRASVSCVCVTAPPGVFEPVPYRVVGRRCCCCCSTQRAHAPDPQAREPLSLWTEVWPTQPVLTRTELVLTPAVNRQCLPIAAPQIVFAKPLRAPHTLGVSSAKPHARYWRSGAARARPLGCRRHGRHRLQVHSKRCRRALQKRQKSASGASEAHLAHDAPARLPGVARAQSNYERT